MSNRYDNSRVKGFLRAEGMTTVNAAGEEVLLRGWGAGNWTNPEGFMLGIGTGYMGDSMNPGLALPRRFTSGRTMTQVIRDLCGSEYARRFWPRWWLNHLGEADIRAMAAWGYNSVRLPLTAWALLPEEPELRFSEEGFAMLDRVLDWCEKYHIYAVIDLHGAPGGQSGLACDDGLDNIPRMFMEPESRERALALWEEIARRYGDRWIVGGYDLLNEPISIGRWHHLTPELERFYDDAIARIRRHDKNHICFLEGTLFSTNMSIFHRDYDPDCHNWGVSVHLYNVSPEQRELYKFIEVQRRLNVPVWIGEGRLKDPDMAVFYEIAAAHHMGFNLWVWKSVENDEDSGACAYRLPEGFDAVLKFCTEGGPRPGYAESARLFDALLEAVRYENCRVNEGAHRHCQRRQGIALPGAGYDPVGFSGGWALGNPMGYRAEDGTRLVMKDGARVPDGISFGGPPPRKDPLGSLLLRLDEGEYASYTVRFVKTPCAPVVSARSPEGATLLASNGVWEETIELPAGAAFVKATLPALEPGDEGTVRLTALRGCAQVEEISFPE